MRYRLIYVFRINDKAHSGCLKIGEATAPPDTGATTPPDAPALNAAAHDRIRQYTQTAGVAYELLHTRLAIGRGASGEMTCFSDRDVHRVLENSGVARHSFDTRNNANEWFETDLQTAKRAIEATAEGRQALTPGEVSAGRDPIIFRPEQRRAIDQAKRQFRRGSRMLWNAKMRFGKTLSALQLAREMGARRTLILTHRPVVDNGWFEDFGKIFYDCADKWRYGSKTHGHDIGALLAHTQAGGHAVYFASMQDLRGSDSVGGKFDKNSAVFSALWDLLIVDEAHEGTQTQLGQSVIEALWRPKEGVKLLELSGTPFNLLEKNNYADGEVFTWDYIAEQRAKTQWDALHPGDPNPYADLPTMNIFTYDLGRLMCEFVDDDVAFNFTEFFRTRQADGEPRFIHEADVRRFLGLLCEPGDSLYPYSTPHFRDLFRHTLWVLPGVREARAMADMLRGHATLQAFTIVNVAGDGDDGQGSNALEAVRRAIGPDPDASRTITLSCGRLTTGVSVPEWTGVFVMAGSAQTAASAYMQTIFRVQTPFRHAGRVKDQCYVFDFAPDRTLKIIADAANRAALLARGQGGGQTVGDFLTFCPVIAMDGSRMTRYDAAGLMEQLKKVQIERVVSHGFEDACLYDPAIIGNIADIDVGKFDDLREIVGSTAAQPKVKSIDINKQGLDGAAANETRDKKKTAHERDERAETLKKRRDAAISILRGISIRMPLLIYGADISDEDGELTIDNFTALVDDASWQEFMPAGVTKQRFNLFRRYYDAAVFHAAGVRIRSMARSADRMGVEQRIGRLAALFSTFRNPDKETVLTPWRVVNMHMAETIGGWTFFDEKWQAELETPRLVTAEGDVTKRTLSPEARVLEVNSKSGLYPLYVTYSIWRARQERYEKTWGEGLTVAQQQELWDMTVRENVFILCKTPMAAAITRRTLMGFRSGAAVNAACVPDLLTKIADDAQGLAKEMLTPKFWNKTFNDKTMKFDAVVGNPPYQVKKDDTSDMPVYHHFMNLAFMLSDFVSLITPGRFLFNAGKTPKEFNEQMLNDEHFKVVRYEPNSTKIFSNVDIKGGIAITMRDSKRKFGKIICYTAYHELNGILTKVVERPDFKSINCLIRLQNKFNLDALYADHPEYKAIIGSGGREKRLTTPIFSSLDVFKINGGGTEQVRVLGLVNNTRTFRYIDAKYLEPHDNLGKWKVILPASNGSGAIGEVLSTPIIGEPIIGYTQSFIGIGCFDTESEADAALKYVKSKFMRTMLGILKVTQHNHIDVWKFVPLQDFTPQSDIDWSGSVESIDRQLYDKYGLTAEERDFIEVTIRPMA